jgi:uncharacterized protein (DUF2126 family)
LIPAYEDAFYYTWKERRFPSNVTPEKSNLKDKQERERIARIFQQGLARSSATRCRSSARGRQAARLDVRLVVFARRRHALADSRRFPMGLRLPLDSVPWVAEKDFPWLRPQDPSNQICRSCRRNFRIASASSVAFRRERRAVAARQGPGQRAQKLGEKKAARTVAAGRRSEPPSRAGQSAPWIIRTALCVEPRDGAARFHAAGGETEDYLDLIAGIETTASPKWVCRSSSKAKRRRAIRA